MAAPVAPHWPPALGWRERLHARLDGLLASERFRRWAAAFPLTRPIARRRAAALFDLVSGFVYSQVLLACVRLELFDLLAAEGPLDGTTLARRLALPDDAAARLLDAAVALRLLALRQGRYALGPLGAALVGNAAVRAMVEHHDAFYDDLRDPVALLRRGTGDGALAGYWGYAGSEPPQDLTPERVARYSTLMSASQPLVADEVLDAYRMDRRRCLLDVGGGEGTFLCTAARRAPALKLVLFDLPAVAERARARFAAEGLADRARAVGGSFLVDPLPEGADTVSLVRVLHDHDDDTVRTILRAVRRVLPPDGELLIAEPMAGLPGVAPMADAYFGFYLMAMGRGRARTPGRLGELLREAGFDAGRRIPTRLPIQTALLVARPAERRREVTVESVTSA
jgi:demethylspheroidene O-methyltransferase